MTKALHEPSTFSGFMQQEHSLHSQRTKHFGLDALRLLGFAKAVRDCAGACLFLTAQAKAASLSLRDAE